MKKALVVDNNPVLLKMISVILEKMQLQVKTAKDGLAALDVLQTYYPDIIFIDLVMPRISGEKLCVILRSMPQFQKTYFVILSAIAPEQHLDFKALDINACIAKGPIKAMESSIAYVLNMLTTQQYDALIDRVIGIENIYEREITKELLVEREHFEIALNHMSDGFLELSDDFKVVFANIAAARLLGLAEERLLSFSFLEIFQDDARRLIMEIMEKLDESHVQIGEQEPFVHLGRYLFLKFELVKNSLNSYIVIIEDITERKQAEEKIKQYNAELEEGIEKRTQELRQTNELLSREVESRKKTVIQLQHEMLKLEMLTGSIGVGLAEISRDYKVVWANKIVRGLFGDVIGSYCYKAFNRKDVDCEGCPVREVFENGKQKAVSEQKGCDIDGKLIWSEMTATPLYAENGTIMSALEVLVPITARKRAEAERECLINALQQSLNNVKQLSGMLPICASCKKIRDDQGYWNQVELYIRDHSAVEFSHSICPECTEQLYGDFLRDHGGNKKFSYIIDVEMNLVRVVAKWAFTIDDILSGAECLYADPLFRKNMNSIVDLTRCSLEFDYSRMSEIITFIRKNENIRGKGRIAVMVSGDLMYGIISMLAVLVVVTQTKIKPFRNMKNALKWIKET